MKLGDIIVQAANQCKDNDAVVAFVRPHLSVHPSWLEQVLRTGILRLVADYRHNVTRAIGGKPPIAHLPMCTANLTAMNVVKRKTIFETYEIKGVGIGHVVKEEIITSAEACIEEAKGNQQHAEFQFMVAHAIPDGCTPIKCMSLMDITKMHTSVFGTTVQKKIVKKKPAKKKKKSV